MTTENARELTRRDRQSKAGSRHLQLGLKTGRAAWVRRGAWVEERAKSAGTNSPSERYPASDNQPSRKQPRVPAWRHWNDRLATGKRQRRDSAACPYAPMHPWCFRKRSSTRAGAASEPRQWPSGRSQAPPAVAEDLARAGERQAAQPPSANRSAHPVSRSLPGRSHAAPCRARAAGACATPA